MARYALMLCGLLSGFGCSKPSASVSPPEPAPSPFSVQPVVATPPLEGEFAGKSLKDWDAEIRSGEDKRRALGLSAAYAMGSKALPLVPTILDLPEAIQPPPTWAIEKIGETAVPTLIAAAKTGSQTARGRAIQVLTRMDPVPPDAVPVLVAAVGDNHYGINGPASEWAIKAGAVAKDAGPTLAKRLADPDRFTRDRAAHILAAVDPSRDPEKVAAVLLAPRNYEELQQVNFDQLRRTFNKLGPAAVPALDKAVKTVTPQSWSTVWYPAEGVGPKAAVVMAELLRKPSNPSPSFGIDLGKFGPEAKDAVPTLLSIMKEEKPFDRGPNAQTLAMLALAGIGAKEVEPLAIAKLKSPHDDDRTWAFAALGTLGSEKVIPLAIQELEKKSTGFDGSVRHYALHALALLAPKAKDQIVPVLQKHLTHEHAHYHTCAALGLLPLTPDDPEVYKPWLPGLTANQITPEWIDLDKAIRKLGPKAVPPLRKLLTDRDPKVRLKSAYAILLFTPADESATKVFVASVMTAEDCKLFRQLAKPAADRVADFVADEITDVRHAALEVIKNRGPDAVACVPALSERLKVEKQLYVKNGIINALAMIGPSAKAALPEVLEQLKSPDETTQNVAAGAVGAIEPGNQAGVPILLKQRQQPWAVEALYKSAPEVAIREGIAHPKSAPYVFRK